MEEKTIKVFTIEEANSLLPDISRRFDEVTSISERSKSLKTDIENLVYIWGKDVMEKGHVDNDYYIELLASRQKAQNALEEKVHDIENLGCVVKDADSGLVDFYFDNGGTLVFLCWRMGEKKVSHWHSLEGSFASRAHISQL